MIAYKKYHEFIDEISPNEIYEGLLAHGLFNEKLPPIFTSKSFYDFCKSNAPTFSKEATNYVFYENIRNINIPRPLGIPNPMAYQLLCKNISEIWVDMQNHFKVQTEHQAHKISRIHLRKMKDKQCLFEMNYDNWKVDGSPEPDLLIGKKYLVSADISNCFPSIYTHALSWALVGKEEAKREQKDHSKWYNKLDFYTRNIKNGETHGLLIGPHVSNLLSEIILVNVDKVLYDKGFKFIRNIDDYTFYAETYEKCQEFLIQLSSSLRDYDLTLNYKKTKILELPRATSEQWIRKINAFNTFEFKPTLNYKDVQTYLDLSLDLMKGNNDNAAILNYAIKVLSKKTLTANAKQYFLKTVYHLCIIYPYIIPLLENNVFIPCGASKDSVSEISQLIFDTNIKSQNYEGVSFALYFAIKYEFVLTNLDFNSIKESNNAICLLLSYLYICKNGKRNDKKLYTELAKHLASNEDTFNLFWIFIYECLPKSSLRGQWKYIKNNSISFIFI